MSETPKSQLVIKQVREFSPFLKRAVKCDRNLLNERVTEDVANTYWGQTLHGTLELRGQKYAVINSNISDEYGAVTVEIEVAPLP